MTSGAKTEFYDLINRRATCRNYLPDAIPNDVMARILEAGCKSPSAGGFQTYSIVKVTNRETCEELVNCSRGQKFIATAPAHLIFCIDYHRIMQVIEQEPAPMRETDGLQNFWMALVDISICAHTICLAAEAEGLASCYNGNIVNKIDKVSELLKLPDHVIPALMMTVGYPKQERKQPTKYPVSLLVHDEVYRNDDPKMIYEEYRKQNNYQKIPARDELVEKLCATAAAYHGEEYAAKVRKDVEEKGFIGSYQYWFGCWYLDEPDFLVGAADFDRFFKKKGFGWLSQE